MSALEQVIEIVEAHGFYRDPEDDDFMGVTLWTCDAWAEWWTDPRNPEKPPSRRKMVLLDVLADIIGEESGWESIRSQPQETKA